MKDFARIAVGILLLGLAIYLSLNFDEETAEGDPADAATAVEPTAESPEWQARPDSGTMFASIPSGQDFVRPRFDLNVPPEARPLQPAESLQDNLIQPPRIADHYSPASTLTVAGLLEQESSLVPVQPKPSFTGTISYARQLHTIREGDSLQSIAREFYGSSERYLDIYLLNKDILSNPAQLPIGVEIRIPNAN